MDYCEFLEKDKELRVLKKELKEDISKKLLDLGHHSVSIIIDPYKIRIKTREELIPEDIQILENVFKIRMSLCKKIFIKNKGDFSLYMKKNETTEVFDYTFRGNYNL